MEKSLQYLYGDAAISVLMLLLLAISILALVLREKMSDSPLIFSFVSSGLVVISSVYFFDGFANIGLGILVGLGLILILSGLVFFEKNPIFIIVGSVFVIFSFWAIWSRLLF